MHRIQILSENGVDVSFALDKSSGHSIVIAVIVIF